MLTFLRSTTQARIIGLKTLYSLDGQAEGPCLKREHEAVFSGPAQKELTVPGHGAFCQAHPVGLGGSHEWPSSFRLAL